MIIIINYHLKGYISNKIIIMLYNNNNNIIINNKKKNRFQCKNAFTTVSSNNIEILATINKKNFFTDLNYFLFFMKHHKFYFIFNNMKYIYILNKTCISWLVYNNLKALTPNLQNLNDILNNVAIINNKLNENFKVNNKIFIFFRNIEKLIIKFFHFVKNDLQIQIIECFLNHFEFLPEKGIMVNNWTKFIHSVFHLLNNKFYNLPPLKIIQAEFFNNLLLEQQDILSKIKRLKQTNKSGVNDFLISELQKKHRNLINKSKNKKYINDVLNMVKDFMHALNQQVIILDDFLFFEKKTEKTINNYNKTVNKTYYMCLFKKKKDGFDIYNLGHTILMHLMLLNNTKTELIWDNNNQPILFSESNKKCQSFFTRNNNETLFLIEKNENTPDFIKTINSLSNCKTTYSVAILKIIYLMLNLTIRLIGLHKDVYKADYMTYANKQLLRIGPHFKSILITLLSIINNNDFKSNNDIIADWRGRMYLSQNVNIIDNKLLRLCIVNPKNVLHNLIISKDWRDKLAKIINEHLVNKHKIEFYDIFLEFLIKNSNFNEFRMNEYDVSASALQILVCLQPTPEVLPVLNFEKKVDPYTFLTNMIFKKFDICKYDNFFKKKRNQNFAFDILKNRKFLKLFWMTFVYGSKSNTIASNWILDSGCTITMDSTEKSEYYKKLLKVINYLVNGVYTIFPILKMLTNLSDFMIQENKFIANQKPVLLDSYCFKLPNWKVKVTKLIPLNRDKDIISMYFKFPIGNNNELKTTQSKFMYRFTFKTSKFKLKNQFIVSLVHALDAHICYNVKKKLYEKYETNTHSIHDAFIICESQKDYLFLTYKNELIKLLSSNIFKKMLSTPNNIEGKQLFEQIQRYEYTLKTNEKFVMWLNQHKNLKSDNILKKE